METVNEEKSRLKRSIKRSFREACHATEADEQLTALSNIEQCVDECWYVEGRALRSLLEILAKHQILSEECLLKATNQAIRYMTTINLSRGSSTTRHPKTIRILIERMDTLIRADEYSEPANEKMTKLMGFGMPFLYGLGSSRDEFTDDIQELAEFTAHTIAKLRMDGMIAGYPERLIIEYDHGLS